MEETKINFDSILGASAAGDGRGDDDEEIQIKDSRGRPSTELHDRQQSLEKKLKVASASLDMDQILEVQETRDDFQDS